MEKLGKKKSDHANANMTELMLRFGARKTESEIYDYEMDTIHGTLLLGTDNMASDVGYSLCTCFQTKKITFSYPRLNKFSGKMNFDGYDLDALIWEIESMFTKLKGVV